MKLFAGRTTYELARQIVKKAGVKLGQVSFKNFSDGELQLCLEETVRGDYVFIIQSTYQPVDNLFELLMMIDAARRASAYKIAAVIPYFGYARQDRKDRPRVCIASKLIANLLNAAGVDRIMTMDLHADQIQGFFDVPVDHLYSSSVFIPYIRSLQLDNMVIASPDTGGSKRADAYSRHLQCELVICHKTRTKPNIVDNITVIGNVENKNVILLDDMIDTAGTISSAADAIKLKGAASVRVLATHPVLSGPAYERIENSGIDQLIVTDTIPLQQELSKIKVLSIADIFADVIQKVYTNQSISTSFVF